MAGTKQFIKLAIAAGVAVLAAVTPTWISVLLFVIAAFLIAWAIQPKRTEEFVGRLPYAGDYILKALAKLDSMLSRGS
jgi:chromate transport protein ChrA